MMKPGELLDHPKQWRVHDEDQAGALTEILVRIGITDSLKAYYSERAGGRLVTWDVITGMVVAQATFKILYEIVATPLTYWVVGRVKQYEGVEQLA
jgi:hypothetical protein